MLRLKKLGKNDVMDRQKLPFKNEHDIGQEKRGQELTIERNENNVENSAN